MSPETLEDWLSDRLAELLGIAADDVDPDAPFAELGLDSMQAVAISGDLEELLGRSLDPALLWEFPTIKRLAAELGA